MNGFFLIQLIQITYSILDYSSIYDRQKSQY